MSTQGAPRGASTEPTGRGELTDGTKTSPGTVSGRGESRGAFAVLILVYGIFALSATARSGVQILRDFSAAPIAFTLSLAAALTYIAVTVALARAGSRSRAALVLCGIELAGVLSVGTLTLLDPELFPEATVWSLYGAGYGFVPLALPILALALLLRRRRHHAR